MKLSVRRSIAAVTAGLVAFSLFPIAADAVPHPGNGKGRFQAVQLLAINDFHGNIEPPQGSSGKITEINEDGEHVDTPAGGAEHLATALRDARQGEKVSYTVAAGDMIGGSPFLSGLFHDEPTVEVLDELGLDVSSVGNHEFDEGHKELQRMQNGGCHPTDGCYGDEGYQGANFQYLAANVTEDATGKTALPPVFVKKVKGVKMGFIGVTLEGTPDLVTPEGTKGVSFSDEVKTINKYTEVLKRQGIKSIVALVHEGGEPPADAQYNYDCNADGISGPIVDIAKNINSEVDAVVSGHTHSSYVCDIPDPEGKSRLVTSAASYGRLYTDINLTYDHATKNIVRSEISAANHIVRRDVAPAQDITTTINKWNVRAEEVANRPIGHISEDLLGRGSSEIETPLGTLIADTQLASSEDAVIALMNPGGVRSDLQYAAAGSEGDGVVTYAEAYATQPFGNMLMTRSFTGEQLILALQQQFSGDNAERNRVLHVSEGFTYTVDMSKTGAERVLVDTVKLNGVALDPNQEYRVVLNGFLAGGGDGFTILGEGNNEVIGDYDLDAFVDWMQENTSASSPYTPSEDTRITVING